MEIEETEKLKNILHTVYEKANTGATLLEVMEIFKRELPEITNKEYIIK